MRLPALKPYLLQRGKKSFLELPKKGLASASLATVGRAHKILLGA